MMFQGRLATASSVDLDARAASDVDRAPIIYGGDDVAPASACLGWLPGPSGAVGRPANKMRLFGELISTQIANGRWKQARRLVWRGVRFPVSTLRWLDTLERLRILIGLKRIPFDLARKPGSTFLHRSLRPADRVSLLTAHYNQILSTMSHAFVENILCGEMINLAIVRGKSAETYHLYLGINGRYSKEGEFSVELSRRGDGRCLASLTFVMGDVQLGAPPCLWIGGLQGCKGADAKAITVQTTRDLYDLRPKDLMIHAAYALGDIFGARRLKAISNAAHVNRRAKSEDGWPADYDAFWRELGGTPISGGYFLLPKDRRRRAAEDVAPKKRKVWRARYQLVDEMRREILELLGAWSSSQEFAPLGHPTSKSTVAPAWRQSVRGQGIPELQSRSGAEVAHAEA
jgi:uncharacterized protein VirK/YbjX